MLAVPVSYPHEDALQARALYATSHPLSSPLFFFFFSVVEPNPLPHLVRPVLTSTATGETDGGKKEERKKREKSVQKPLLLFLS
jgi:hypothetical protein